MNKAALTVAEAMVMEGERVRRAKMQEAQQRISEASNGKRLDKQALNEALKEYEEYENLNMIEAFCKYVDYAEEVKKQREAEINKTVEGIMDMLFSTPKSESN